MPAEKNFGMRLRPHERREIERLAALRGTTMKEAVLEAVRRQLEALHDDAAAFTPRPGGLLEGLGDLVGSFDSGLGDLSTNKEHLKGYGE